MRSSKLRRLAAGLTAALALSLFALPCAAEPKVEMEDGDVLLPADDSDQQQTYTCGNYTYSIMVNTQDETQRAACLQKYSGLDTEIIIPSELDGLEVIALGDTVYTENPHIMSVTIPKSVIAIGSYSFAECVNIQKYTVEEGNPYYSSTDDGMLLADDGHILVLYPPNTKAESVTVPDGTASIGDSAFAFSGFKEVTLPESVTSLGKAAFLNCTALESVNIPSGVTVIPESLFQNCTALKHVTLPDGITEIGRAAFAATGLESITLPDSLTAIGDAAFAGTQLNVITVPPAVQDIGDSALGYDLSPEYDFVVRKGFTVKGYQGSAAQQYCLDDDNADELLFEAIEPDEPEENSSADADSSSGNDSAAEATQTENGSRLSAGRIIGIAVCVVLLIVIVVVAAVTGKKEKKKDA